ncbi:IniB N-terminal domain-containing protein [Pseudarthrobacter sp. NamB4]|uniref:IniB N-terminal domain-containing protein n=1 Tax=Pseudarthrobacter sp. NamB4 TaxID=2576837 RepID=UPI00197B0738|nr:IniB N-terminal domain-containing protein [Pseudarthrobacter sp. NamB4]
MTVAKDVVQFLMNIFGDRQAAQEFLDNPEGVLRDHGLGGLSSADVDAAMPVVLDYAPVNVNASTFDKVLNTGGSSGGGGPHDDHGHAVEQLAQVVANYSYPSTADDRAAVLDQPPAHNIWAEGDVEQWFDNDAVFAGPAAGATPEMSFADIRIDHLFDLDAGTEAGVEETVPGSSPGNSSEDALSHLVATDTIEETILGADDVEFGLTGDESGTIDAEDDADDAGGEAADYLEFGA